MMLGGISNSYPNPYVNISNSQAGAHSADESLINAGSSTASGRTAEPEHVSLDPEHQVKRGYKSSPAECKTCRERKYQDGSDEGDVSFKTPGHISPEASAATVAAHEHEHVVNAYEKAAKNNGKVLSCSVSLHTAICPECGTSYVSGGLTSTTIAYPNEDNPYQKDKKARDSTQLTGANIDYIADQYKRSITK